MDRLGQQLGNYRLHRLLGKGGFAEVYLGEHIFLGTTVAIKVLHTRVAEEDVAQFQQEARLLASLTHPQIIHVLEFGIEEQVPYLVMEYAPRGTLRTNYPKGSRLPLATVVSYIKQAASALQYAHERKIIHRDIKPENMLLNEQGQLLLSDFGIALITQSSSYQSTKDMAGTITYMAPEQIGAHPRPASDQYSLGIVAYEWLCGTRPFQGSFTEIAIKHSVTPPPPLREYVPTLSREVEQVILTALSKQPEERFATVRAFATALEQASQTSGADPSADVASSFSPAAFPLRGSAVSSPASERAISLSKQSTPSAITPPTPLAASVALPTPEQTTGKRRFSRRSMLLGAVGIAAIATVGTGAVVMAQQQSSQRNNASWQSTGASPSITRRKQPFIYRMHNAAVNAVAWSPDGKWIASGGDDNTVQVWDASDGNHVFTYRGHSDIVTSIAWSPDGKRIASGSHDMTVQVWNAHDGSDAFTYKGHNFSVYAVAWSPDGKRIASGSEDGTAVIVETYNGRVQIWNAHDGSDAFIYKGHKSSVYAVAWSPDGKWIASGSKDSTVQVWTASNGSIMFSYKEHNASVDSVAWSPDGKWIASGSKDSTVRVWTASDGSHVLTYKGHTDAVNAVAWSPDGKQIASGSYDETVQVWNVSDGSHVRTNPGHRDIVLTLAWSPDGKRIASGGVDWRVLVWSVS